MDLEQMFATVLANQFTQHQQTGLRFLVQFGLDYCAAIGQSCFNNDFRQAHKNNVSGRKSTQTKKKKKATGVNTVGAFHLLSSNAQKCLIRFAKEQTKEQQERFDKYLKAQFQTSMDKKNNAWKKFLDERTKRYLDVMFCLHLYHSPCCQSSAAQTRQEFARLGCESERLRIFKQQFLFCVLGLGIEKAHHPYGLRVNTSSQHMSYQSG